MKAFKLVLTGIVIIIYVILVTAKPATWDGRAMHPGSTKQQQDTPGCGKKEALIAFPLYTPVSMPY